MHGWCRGKREEEWRRRGDKETRRQGDKGIVFVSSSPLLLF
jgi:hypothetical protein